jgi:predicted acetyltransferase
MDERIGIIDLADVPRAALADFLAEFGPGDFGPRDFAESKGYCGVDGFVEFWTRLVHGPWPELGLVQTDALILMRGERVAGEALFRHNVTPALAINGGNIGYTVRPRDRNRGYATLLLRAALARAAAAGIERALLTVRVDNGPSLRVVEKCDGVPFDEVPFEGTVLRRFWVPTGFDPGARLR